ncbi:hypothetical protein L484_015505 [Morus notabilis]|uniref:Uncharacterized protein n=1 Tax=Morus notabilis TaxID=981085 RepID=W9RIU2_9ROSA|nr:hypothetical protein L484_015505 [Morus notabilis]
MAKKVRISSLPISFGIVLTHVWQAWLALNLIVVGTRLQKADQKQGNMNENLNGNWEPKDVGWVCSNWEMEFVKVRVELDGYHS